MNQIGHGERPLVSQLQAAARMRDWMRKLDYPDAELADESTCPTVRSAEAVAQVDFESRPVSLLAVQALSGVAAFEQRVPLFFARGGFGGSAQQWAARAGMGLFRFDDLGHVEGIGRLGVCLAKRAGSVARQAPADSRCG